MEVAPAAIMSLNLEKEIYFSCLKLFIPLPWGKMMDLCFIQLHIRAQFKTFILTKLKF
jgi:hypothetical protein